MPNFHGMDYRPAYPRGGSQESELHRRRFGKNPSSSYDGKKGPNCKTSPEKKFWLTSTKAYKRKGYDGNYAAIIKKAGTKQ
jgi:hypothetical protein